jgi:soluble lytic murein transglycosylase-like protein
MKILPSIALLIISFALVSSAHAQKVFDNFDRAQGVNVVLPPAPKVEPFKKGRRGKYASAQNQLVKRTVLTANVTDGLATREGQPMVPTSYSKLNMGSNTMLKGFTTGNPLHDSYIVDSSRRYGIDPLLIYSQMHQESSFKLTARSYKGASGLMQLMPATARRFGVTQIYDPKQNIDAGVRYMRWLLDTFNGDVVLALAGYNAGEGAVMKYGWNIPPYRETQEYVRRITSRYNSISDGTYVQIARRSNNTARFEQKESRPLTTYEPSPLAVRTSDGQLMLVNQ